MIKAIDTGSFHYRYYCWIRKIWGFDPPKEFTSLCPYCQTMLWGSIFCIVFSWCLVPGYICMKLGRLVTKIEFPLFDKFMDWLEQKSGILEQLEKGPDRFIESPLVTGVIYTLMGISILATIVLVVLSVGVIFSLLGMGIWNIKTVISTVAYVLAHFGWLGTMCLYLLGWLFVAIWENAVWLFTNGELWWTVGSWIVYGLAAVLSFGAASVVLCITAIGIAKLQFVRNIGTLLMNKFNGFAEAKTARTERLKAVTEKKKSSDPPWTCYWCKYDNNPGDRDRCRECESKRVFPSRWLTVFDYILLPISWPLGKCASGYEKIKDKRINFAGPFAIVWEYIVAIKKGVCPIFEFVDKAAVRSKQQEAAKERMDTEKKQGH